MDMMDDFGDGFDEIDAFAADENFFLNASATFETLAQQPPHQAYPFDDSRVGEAQRVEARVLSPFTGEELEADNIVFENHADGRPPERAYWIGRKLLDCIYGCIRVCTILEYRNDEFVPWQTTNQRAAVKVMSWHRIQSLDHAENPISEIAALQHVCRDGQHDHVMGALDVLQDDDYLLVFMPYFASGSLYDFVSRAERFPENVARYWFRQIIDVRLLVPKIPVSNIISGTGASAKSGCVSQGPVLGKCGHRRVHPVCYYRPRNVSSGALPL